MGHAADRAIAREERLRRPPPPPATPWQPSFPAGAPATEASFLAGKIIEVNRPAREVHLALINAGVDPRDPDQWGDDNNFDMLNPVCC